MPTVSRLIGLDSVEWDLSQLLLGEYVTVCHYLLTYLFVLLVMFGRIAAICVPVRQLATEVVLYSRDRTRVHIIY